VVTHEFLKRNFVLGQDATQFVSSATKPVPHCTHVPDEFIYPFGQLNTQLVPNFKVQLDTQGQAALLFPV